MTVSVGKPPDALADQGVPLPRFFDTDLITTPSDNPVYSTESLADLIESLRVFKQLVPGWVCPSPELPENKRLCIEGNRRLKACQLLGLKFWAFDIGRIVPEAERIKLLFQHNHSRRQMSRDEIAERAARYMELTGCPAAEAAKQLNISSATLSRVFGERRIPAELKPKAATICQSVRSLVAAAPPTLMGKALEYALAKGADDKPPTRDEVAQYIRQLKRSASEEGGKPRPVTLRVNGRAVTLTVGSKDSAISVAEDLKSIVAKLGKHAEVPPDGWPFLFQ